MKSYYLICICILVSLTTIFADDDGSGSGNYEEDPMRMARESNGQSNEEITQNFRAETRQDDDMTTTSTRHITKRSDNLNSHFVHRLSRRDQGLSGRDQGMTNDIDSENLMAQTGGSKQVAHTVSAKLVDHTNRRMLYQAGNSVEQGFVNKKSDVSSGKKEEKNKALSSTSEVVLPISSVAKLTNTTEAKDNVDSTQSKNETSADTAVEKPSTEVKNFVDAPPIAPMESIKVEVKGKSTAYSNFTQPSIEGEEVRNNKIDVLKFEDGLVNPTDGYKKNTIDGTKGNKKTYKEIVSKKSSQKKTSKKQKKRSSKKSKKSSKRSKISTFPKIILYQGPISKALESMLSVHSTPSLKEQSSFINAPMTFEQATADIKRSRIPKTPDTSDETSNSDGYSERRSKLTKSPKKYNIKGYPDGTVTGERKSMRAKKSKNVKGKKKFSFAKNKNTQLKDGVPSLLNITSMLGGGNVKGKAEDGEKEEEGPFGFPSFVKAFPIFSAADNPLMPGGPSNKKPDNEKTQDKKPNSQLFDPLKERPYKPTPQNDNQNTKEVENKTSTAIFPSISLSENNGHPNNPEEEEEEPPSDKDNGKPPTPPPLLDIGNEKPAATAEEGKEEDNEDDEDDNIQVNNNKNATSGSLRPSIVMEPLQKNPLPTPISNSGTPNPVINLPDNLPKPPTKLPGPIDQILGKKPEQVPPNPQLKITSIDQTPVNKPNLNVDKPPPIQQPNLVAIEPGNGNILPMDPNGGMSEEEGRELLDQVDSNAQTIDTLSSEMRALETRLTELESAVNDVTEDVRKLEKKVVTKPHKQATNSFTEFVGPLQNLQGDVKGPKLPKIFSIFGKLRGQKPSSLRQAKRPKFLKEFFVPLPPANSPAAKAIENGAPINGLPFPLNIIVSKIFKKMEKVGPSEQGPNQSPITVQGPFPFPLPSKMPFQPKPWRQPQPLPEVSFPPTEHDIDQLELEMGKTPITRYPSKVMKKPKIIIFSKSPRIFDLTEKPCDEPCMNGGSCMGGNVCKCPFSFSGPKCEKPLQRSPIPEDILDILGGEPEMDSDTDDEPRKSNLISLPLMVSNVKQIKGDEDADDDQKTVGMVEQNKIVNMLRQIGKSFPFMPELAKRNRIPNPYSNNEFPFKSRYEQDIVPRSEIYERYRVPGESSEFPDRFRYQSAHDYYRKKH